MENDLREAGRQQASRQLESVRGRGTCCMPRNFSEYSRNCQEKYFSISSSSSRKGNEKNLKIHKTKQKKHLQIAHSLYLSLSLSFPLSPNLCYLTGMCCNSVSALLWSPSKSLALSKFFLFICTNAWAFQFSDFSGEFRGSRQR